MIYTLDVQQTSPAAELRKRIEYKLYVSNDGGATRELRHSGTIGGCYIVNVSILKPRSATIGSGHIGLATQCVDSPSASRGLGTTLFSSYDGGRTFFERIQG